MSWIQVIGAFEMGLIFSLVAFGVYLSFRVLQFPDMTVDGSFPLGACVSAALIIGGVHPFWATLVAVFSGFFMGVITSLLSTHLRMLNLLAGILSMTGLYSINLRVMGRPNMSLLGEKTIFSVFTPSSLSGIMPLSGLILTFCFFLLYAFLNTHLGLALRATGNNPRMARANGINDSLMIAIGLGVSNALVSYAGSLFTQAYGFADVTMGVGTIVEGLAAIIIGEALFHVKTLSRALLACICGAIVYRIVIALALDMSGSFLHATDHNLIKAFLVGFAMLIPSLKLKIKRT
jgi:putative ABC transport system permease protein